MQSSCFGSRAFLLLTAALTRSSRIRSRA
jgi:hypothetical protein